MLKGGLTRCRPNSSTSTILMKIGRTTLQGMRYRYQGFIL